MKDKLNTWLLLICVALLATIAVGVFTRPTLSQIDARIMYWGQHFGAAFQK